MSSADQINHLPTSPSPYPMIPRFSDIVRITYWNINYFHIFLLKQNTQLFHLSLLIKRITPSPLTTKNFSFLVLNDAISFPLSSSRFRNRCADT